LINDASSDNSWHVIRKLADTNKNIIGYNLRNNAVRIMPLWQV